MKIHVDIIDATKLMHINIFRGNSDRIIFITSLNFGQMGFKILFKSSQLKLALTVIT